MGHRVISIAGAVMVLLAHTSSAQAVTCEVPSGLFPTIQSAIDTSSCDRIAIAAGTYVEQLEVSRTVALEGTGADVTVIQAPAVLAVPKAIVRVTGAATDATIRDVAIQGPGGGPCDSLRAGVRVDGNATVRLQGSRVVAIRDTPLGGCQNGVAILVGRRSEGQIGHALVSHNRIEDYQKGGVVVDGPGSTASISDNSVQGGGFRCCGLAAQNGIQVSRGAVAQIVHNDVADNRYDPSVAASGGVLIFEAGSGVAASRNTVDANDVGIWVIATQGAVVDGNRVTGSTFDGVALDNQNFTVGASTTQNVVRNNHVRGNGDGIGLYSADSSLIENNEIAGNSGAGVVVSSEFDFQTFPGLQPSSSANVIRNNHSDENGDVGIFDDSTGSEIGGTANTYAGNHCRDNAGGASSPAGLCE